MRVEYREPGAIEIEQIKAGNIEARNAFFERNYNFIENACVGVLVRKKKGFTKSDKEDLINECYINMPEMDIQRRDYFGKSVYDQYLFKSFGGKKIYYRNRLLPFPVSIDKPVTVNSRSGEQDTGATIADLYVSSPSAEEEYFKGFEVETVDEVLGVIKEYLTPREYQVMEYRFLTDLSAQEIGEEVGRTKGGILSQITTARKKLVIHYREILERLTELGFEKSFEYLERGEIPPDYEEVQEYFERVRKRGRENARRYSSTPEGRERKNARQRAYHARKKAVTS